MATSPPTDPDSTQGSVSSSDRSFTFQIKRVQEWTLGAVVIAAVTLGIWIGTLTTKLDHIERFVNSAEDASAGIFVRLATIQKTLDVLDRNGGGESRKVAESKAAYPPIDVRIPAIELRSSTTSQPLGLDKLVDYMLVEEILKPKNRGSETAPPVSTSGSIARENEDLVKQQSLRLADIATQNEGLVKQRSLWLAEVQTAAVEQLDDLEREVIEGKKLRPATKQYLITLINQQRQRVKSLNP